MNDDLHEIFKLAARYHSKKYRDKGGNQKSLAKKLGVTQSYVSSVLSGTKTASLELQSQIVNILYGGPYEEFLAIGRRIKSGLDPELHVKEEAAGSVESLIAQLTHYVMDHKRIEEELVQMRDFHKSIVENLQAGVIVSDANDDITYLNSYMEILIGIESEKIIGTNQLINDERFPDRKLNALMEYYKKAKNILEPVFYENIFITTSGGNDLWLTGWMIPVKKMNQYAGMIVTIRNMTQRQRLNQSLMATLEYTDCPVAIALQEKEGGPVTSYHMNKEGMELMGINQYAFGHENIKKSILASASLMENGEEWLAFTSKNFEGRDLAEMEIRMKDGRKFIWESKALRDQEGFYHGRIVHIREVRLDRRKEDKNSRQ